MTKEALTTFLLRLGDDRLILGHRLSEWCGHAPILEEDIALANIALDLVGHATMLLGLAAETEGKGRSADDLAYLREATQFRNSRLVEQPNGDFACTIVRQYFVDVYSALLYEELKKSAHAPLAAIAEKCHKEIVYHQRHSGEWVLRLGDGTAESHARIQQALNNLWGYTAELFVDDDSAAPLITQRIVPSLKDLEKRWSDTVRATITKATLTAPPNDSSVAAGRRGLHTEHLGHLLAEMQILARSHPGAKW